MGAPGSPDRSGAVVARDGARLFWTRAGDGADTVVVPGAWMLEGRLGLAVDGRSVLLYDMRSRGRSEPIEETDRLGFRRDVEDLEDLRRHVGLEAMSLVGFSYLGGVVARYAMAHPGRVRRLVLLGAIPPRSSADYVEEAGGTEEHLDPGALRRLEELREEGLEETDPVAYCRAYWRTMLPAYTASPEAAERLADDLDLGCELPNERPAAFGRVLGRVAAELASYDWREEARSLEVPTLVLHGREDHVAPVEGGREWTELLPEGRLDVVEGAGHLLWAERPDRVGRALRRFLAAGGGAEGRPGG